jgi:hypothetical protein
MISSHEFHDAFLSSFREFFGNENELDWEIYHLNSAESSHTAWATFTIRNPLAGRALSFNFNETEDQFHALLKIQVIPGEENWNLDVLFQKKGYTQKDAINIMNESGDWKFHSIARHYFGIILSFCPRILEPDFFID